MCYRTTGLNKRWSSKGTAQQPTEEEALSQSLKDISATSFDKTTQTSSPCNKLVGSFHEVKFSLKVTRSCTADFWFHKL
ncbi:hypothetical protein EYF80_011809 [Liparis tanakae]|uniref:Uncharacterized protein n=1 Tax=Liparis tanakae TaxID=230148 RepID=A0A4Z2IJT0_9TELE|nr:hypothetical protein EYF80_011809 [Liparis tanakae]